MEEIWKDIKGYEGIYQISNFGRIYSVRRKKIRNTYVGKYVNVILSIKGVNKSFTIHRLVAEAFIPNPHNLPCVNHKDENKQNNFVFVNEDETVDLEKSNLEWCDYKYNMNYGTRIERIVNKNTKPILQYDKDEKFLKEWKSGKDIQKQLGFSRGNICECCKGHRKSAGGYIWKYK